MKEKNYEQLFVDYNDPHESNEFWVRLNQIFANSSHTIKSLSEFVGVSERTLSRFLSKKTYSDVIRLVYDVSYACGVTPDVLFNRQIHIPNQDFTGIKSIDRMLGEAYNDSSQTGIAGFAKYVGKEYRLHHERWKVNNDTNSRKYTYFCKFCNRQFVKKDSLLNHMNKTCKVKKDKEISNLELQKLQAEDDQQSKISFIEEKGNKMKLDEMMYETDVSHPFKNGDSDDSDDDISDPGVFESNSYGNIGTNNIPPNPNLVNPDNNNYPNELPEIKDDEKEDYEEFQKLMYI